MPICSLKARGYIGFFIMTKVFCDNCGKEFPVDENRGKMYKHSDVPHTEIWKDICSDKCEKELDKKEG